MEPAAGQSQGDPPSARLHSERLPVRQAFAGAGRPVPPVQRRRRRAPWAHRSKGWTVTSSTQEPQVSRSGRCWSGPAVGLEPQEVRRGVAKGPLVGPSMSPQWQPWCCCLPVPAGIGQVRGCPNLGQLRIFSLGLGQGGLSSGRSPGLGGRMSASTPAAPQPAQPPLMRQEDIGPLPWSGARPLSAQSPLKGTWSLWQPRAAGSLGGRKVPERALPAPFTLSRPSRPQCRAGIPLPEWTLLPAATGAPPPAAPVFDGSTKWLPQPCAILCLGRVASSLGEGAGGDHCPPACPGWPGLSPAPAPTLAWPWPGRPGLGTGQHVGRVAGSPGPSPSLPGPRATPRSPHPADREAADQSPAEL